MLSTHDKEMIHCLYAKTIEGILTPEILKTHTIFLINEGQFFPDLYITVRELVDIHHKKVYVCGLDGDYKREKFGQILDLIPICDNVKKYKAICTVCKNGTKAIFSKRKTQDKKQKIIGINNYIPVCRKCYFKSI